MIPIKKRICLLKAEDLKRLFIRPARRNLELGNFAELHDRASEGAPVVDDDFSVAEYVLERGDIHMD
jgi:hypothetical protein